MRAITPLIIGSSLALLSGQANAQYAFKVVKATGGNGILFEDINKSKQIIETVLGASGTDSCAVLSGKTSTPVADPNGSSSVCYGLSSGAEAVGFYFPTTNPNTLVGFTYSAGTYADYIAAGSNAAQGGTQLNAISPNGSIIAGTYSNAAGYSKIFYLLKGKQHDVSVAGANYLVATGVNDSAQIAAQSFNAGGDIVANYVITKGTAVPVSFPGGNRTTVHGINDFGVVAGNFLDSSGAENGFTFNVKTGIYSAAITVPNEADTVILGINDAGVLSGYVQTSSGTLDGLIATPTK